MLLGATTENPSFEVIGALLSRLKVYLLRPLGESEIERIITRAIEDTDNGLGKQNVLLDDDARAYIIQSSGGDARRALTLLEFACISDTEWEAGNAPHHA